MAIYNAACNLLSEGKKIEIRQIICIHSKILKSYTALLTLHNTFYIKIQTHIPMHMRVNTAVLYYTATV